MSETMSDLSVRVFNHWKKVLFRGCELDDVFPKISMFPTFRSLFLGLQYRIFGQREKP